MAFIIFSTSSGRPFLISRPACSKIVNKLILCAVASGMSVRRPNVVLFLFMAFSFSLCVVGSSQTIVSRQKGINF